MNKNKKAKAIQELMIENKDHKAVKRVIKLRGANYPYSSIYDKLVKEGLIK